MNSIRPQSRWNQTLCCGWLRKQGRKFKSWKRYFFVLEEGYLFYYSTAEKLKCAGSFSLNGNLSISVIPSESRGGDSSCASEERAFHFQINRAPNSTEGLADARRQILLSAATAKERNNWVHALRKYLFLHKGGGVFGTNLFEAFRFVSPDMHYVPRVVFESAQFIRHYGITSDGIFRKCGSRTLINELAEAYDSADQTRFLQPAIHDEHTVAGLLKLYLRELPEPVIPCRYYDCLKATGYQIDDGQDLRPIIEKINTLPTPNYCLLRFLCQFLFEVSTHASENRMTVENLASIFAPNILRQAEEDADVEIAASPVLTVTVASFIRCHDKLFTRELEKLQSNGASFPARPSPVSGLALPTWSSSRSFTHRHSLPPRYSELIAEPETGTRQSVTTSSEATPFWADHVAISGTVKINSAPGGSSGDSALLESSPLLSEQCSKCDVNPPDPSVKSCPLMRRKLVENFFKTSADLSSEYCSRRGKYFSSSNTSTSSSEPGLSSRKSYGISNDEVPTSSYYGGIDDPVDQSDLAEQVRHWRSVAIVARAEAACERAKADSLSYELSRTFCDLKSMEQEVDLLRKKILSLDANCESVFLLPPNSPPKQENS